MPAAPPDLSDREDADAAPPRVEGSIDAESPYPLSVVLAAALIAAVIAVNFVVANRTWLRPFIRDLIAWLGEPSIAGGWIGPADPLIAIPILIAVAGLGWLAADLVLSGTPLGRDRPARTGFTILFGAAALGYAGMLGIVLGALSPPFIASSLVVLAAGLMVGRHWQRGRARAHEDAEATATKTPDGASSPRLRVSAVVVGALIVGASFVHAAMSPVQEWDALVYHAESARQWFEGRPSPPLVFGPSVGIQISANYPPLFPAAGAALSTLIGQFDDLYLRLASPALLLSTALILFGYARERFDERSACFAVLMLVGTPLFLLYGNWPTAYALLACLVLATVILVDLAGRSGGGGRWVAAGAVTGLAALTNFWGALVVVAYPAVIVVARRLSLKSLLLFAGAAAAVAAPWLLRNLVLLGDPLYPLGTPPFDGKGIVEPLWTASKLEISQNALAYWDEAPGIWLRVRQLATALFDRQMLPIGLYFAVLLGLARARREPVLAYLALVLLGLIVLVIAPGWFWLRALVPAIPIAAILTGRVLSLLLASVASPWLGRWHIARRALQAGVAASVAAVILAGSLVGVSLAIAGPNQYTWTTGLGRQDDLMQSVRNLGSPRDQLWTSFSGDLLMWEWLNRNAGAGERIATLELRTYYLDRAGDLFYLDGIEAVPLLDMRSPEHVLEYFRQQQVGFIALPSWSVSGPASHPVSRLLPVFGMLGGPSFPAVAAFAIKGSDEPSVVYAVGPSDLEPTLGVFPGAAAPAMTLEDAVVTIEPDRDDVRIFAPVPPDRAAALTFEYETVGTGHFDVNQLDTDSFSWQLGVFTAERRGHPGWTKAFVPLLESEQPVSVIGIHVIGDPLRLRGVRVVELP